MIAGLKIWIDTLLLM